jgi:uncharacterized protein involved in type VI secretion and phage assembly
MNAGTSALYVGSVEDNSLDADGCIKISLPPLGGSFLARVTTQMAGKGRGVLFLPEVGDQVLVASVLGSDVKWAVIGSLWSRNEMPAETNGDGKNDQKILQTRSGNVIRLIDSDGDERIEIADSSGNNTITISTKSNKVTVTAADSIGLSANSISIEATNGDLVLKGTRVMIN